LPYTSGVGEAENWMSKRSRLRVDEIGCTPLQPEAASENIATRRFQRAHERTVVSSFFFSFFFLYFIGTFTSEWVTRTTRDVICVGPRARKTRKSELIPEETQDPMRDLIWTAGVSKANERAADKRERKESRIHCTCASKSSHVHHMAIYCIRCAFDRVSGLLVGFISLRE